MRVIKNLHYVIICIYTIFIFNLLGEEVSQFRWKLTPEMVDGKVLEIPENSVAMSEIVHVGDTAQTNGIIGLTSLMFVIDNSGSNGQTDPSGNRWSVPNAVIDRLYNTNPNIEIGVSVFGSDLYFDPKDEQLFEKCSLGKYGYIPLLKLNKRYNSTVLGNATGYEILKYYLKHKGYHLDYALLKDALQLHLGTNITIGFRSAKEAMAKALYPKSNQFVIFFSDGQSSTGGNEYIDGKDVPTTFSIFLAPGPSWPIPNELTTMTNNIKANNYSITNPKSDIWKMYSAGHDKILKLIVDNVLPHMFTKVTFTPKKLSINGIEETNWNNGAFTFKEKFPLAIFSDKFDYEITYKREKDSISNSGDTIHVDLGDTLHTVSFETLIKNNPVIADSNEITNWNREIEFFHNGTQITTADETMNDIEFRFLYHDGSTKYEYNNVTLEIQNELGTPIDKENLTLVKNGNTFSATLPRTLGNATVNDGVLQHRNSDNIVAIFRNSKLPLDTLRKVLPFLGSGENLVLTKAEYFDNNANGFIDEIKLHFPKLNEIENILKKFSDDILKEIELPQWRKFSIISDNVTSNMITLKVTEGNNDVNTAVTSKDIVTVKKTISLNSDVNLIKGEVKVTDKVAPVIMKASLVDSLKTSSRDELLLVFSEDVEMIDLPTPTVFWKNGGTQSYTIPLSIINKDKEKVTFELIGGNTVNKSDSININWKAGSTVTDTKKNSQLNGENIKRPIDIEIIDNKTRFTKAIYFDKDANGYIDEIEIHIRGDLQGVKDNIDLIISKISLPSERNLSIDSYSIKKDKLHLHIKDVSSIKNTATESFDILRIKEVPFKEGGKLEKASLKIVDKMAPVIVKATVIDSIITLKKGNNSTVTPLGKDFLEVTFSEKVKSFTKSTPFYFYSTQNSNKKYSVTLQNHEVNKKEYRGYIKEVSTYPFITDGDSININHKSDNCSDLIKNEQDNSKNIKCKVTVKEIHITKKEPADFDFTVKATILDPHEGKFLPKNLSSLSKDFKVLMAKHKDGDIYKGLMLIAVIPSNKMSISKDDFYNATISVYDITGNIILESKEFIYDPKSQNLYLLWNGKNENLRSVGGGSYYGIVTIDKMFLKKSAQKIRRRVLLGVKD